MTAECSPTPPAEALPLPIAVDPELTEAELEAALPALEHLVQVQMQIAERVAHEAAPDAA